jgi:hypothetical protein
MGKHHWGGVRRDREVRWIDRFDAQFRRPAIFGKKKSPLFRPLLLLLGAHWPPRAAAALANRRPPASRLCASGKE